MKGVAVHEGPVPAAKTISRDKFHISLTVTRLDSYMYSIYLEMRSVASGPGPGEISPFQRDYITRLRRATGNVDK
jgi:hypothetical protein